MPQIPLKSKGSLLQILKKELKDCWATEVEDIYLPYKPKRKTRASMAREKGLEPLASPYFRTKKSEHRQAGSSILNDQVETEEDHPSGARDIVPEWINEDEKARNAVRRAFEKRC
ncbi:MAG: Tex-like N-terminal domain-containing protein [Saprospiraceae bacterium]